MVRIFDPNDDEAVEKGNKWTESKKEEPIQNNGDGAGDDNSGEESNNGEVAQATRKTTAEEEYYLHPHHYHQQRRREFHGRRMRHYHHQGRSEANSTEEEYDSTTTTTNDEDNDAAESTEEEYDTTTITIHSEDNNKGKATRDANHRNNSIPAVITGTDSSNNSTSTSPRWDPVPSWDTTNRKEWCSWFETSENENEQHLPLNQHTLHACCPPLSQLQCTTVIFDACAWLLPKTKNEEEDNKDEAVVAVM